MAGTPSHSTQGLILGIESSCDETAAAVVAGGRHTRSNVVASQIATHAPYGGVVPELASREHLRNIVPVVRAALAGAGTTLAALDAIAVTAGPGLAGALLVGITYAKALAFAAGKPLIAVNHLEGHIHAVLLEQAELADAGSDGAAECSAEHPEGAQPALALVVSGGHTHLYLARRTPVGWQYRTVGRTVDDAAGEAFDKVAKLLGLGYPGGPWIDALAPHGDPRAVPFRFAEVRPRPLRQKSPLSAPLPPQPDAQPDANAGPQREAQRSAQLDAQPDAQLGACLGTRRGPQPRTRPAAPPDPQPPYAHPYPAPHAETLFSFSGIKTAVLRYVETHHMFAAAAARQQALAANPSAAPADLLPLCDQQTLNLIASFQHAVVDNLRRRTFDAAERLGAQRLLVSGGVAANRELRVRFTAEATTRDLPLAFPSLALSTDNAAMIAAAAWPKLLSGDLASPYLSANPTLRLGL